jgi:hypothetical protein
MLIGEIAKKTSQQYWHNPTTQENSPFHHKASLKKSEPLYQRDAQAITSFDKMEIPNQMQMKSQDQSSDFGLRKEIKT